MSEAAQAEIDMPATEVTDAAQAPQGAALAPVTAATLQPPAIAPSEAATLLGVITRLASDPQTDMAKITQLMDLHDRLEGRAAEREFTAAFAEMQPKLPAVAERGGITNKAGAVQSTYAKWEDVNEAIKPALARHGFTLSFDIGQEADSITVTGFLKHRGGHAEQTSITLPADHSGSKNPVQAVASSVSYGKRYTGGALLNLTSRGEDDDGRRAGDKTVSDEQATELEGMMQKLDASDADRTAFLNWLKVDSFDVLPLSKFRMAVSALRDKMKAESVDG